MSLLEGLLLRKSRVVAVVQGWATPFNVPDNLQREVIELQSKNVLKASQQ